MLRAAASTSSGKAVCTKLTPEARKAMISLRRDNIPRLSKTAANTAGGIICVTMSGILKTK